MFAIIYVVKLTLVSHLVFINLTRLSFKKMFVRPRWMGESYGATKKSPTNGRRLSEYGKMLITVPEVFEMLVLLLSFFQHRCAAIQESLRW